MTPGPAPARGGRGRRVAIQRTSHYRTGGHLNACIRAGHRHDNVRWSPAIGREVTAVPSANYGSLVAEDELPTHQIVDTLAHASGNSLRIVPGIGRFSNRCVFGDHPNNALQPHQHRDLPVRVEDPIGGGTGLGNAESFALGAFPERGLTQENSFL